MRTTGVKGGNCPFSDEDRALRGLDRLKVRQWRAIRPRTHPLRDALRTALTVNLAATAGLFLCVLLPCWLLGAPFKFVALFALGDFAVGLLGSAVFSAFPCLVITNAAMARQATGRNGHEKWLLSNVRKLSAAAKILSLIHI